MSDIITDIITDKSRKPSLSQIEEYIDDPLFKRLYTYLTEEHKAKTEIMYSGDKVLLGWNVRFFRSNRTLLRLYPKRGGFCVLVVIGRSEKERTEAILPSMCEKTRGIYENTKEGMGQRWLLLEPKADEELFCDILRLTDIRCGK